MSSIFFSLLNGKAFSPDPLDPSFTIQSRLSRFKNVLVVTIGGSGVCGYQARLRGRQWEIMPHERIEGPYLTSALLEQGREMAHSNWVVVSFTPANLLCELENGHLPDDSTLQKALFFNPKSILRTRYEQDRRYQVVASGDRKKYISFSVTSREVVAVEKVVKEVGMGIARIQIGLANVAEMAVRKVEGLRKDGIKRLILVGDQSVILSMAVRDSMWEEPFSFISRTSEGSNADVESVVEYLESLAAEVDEPGIEFYLLHSKSCWWSDAAQKWFQKNASRFHLKKIEEALQFIELQSVLEG